ncbi:hypothetical protein AJ79_06868 [Helicocarpus griseus UAMH5409]|uniref:Uncharacterized protein n=1 Tax=Helicocarpus griseus UAMH5409 TaxID=1447875 RepID=A0A2B7X8C0_9EURO|nr:hypothetical protein AJ79_06868 [Helicocarpus griseus UAMH5409]
MSGELVKHLVESGHLPFAEIGHDDVSKPNEDSSLQEDLSLAEMGQASPLSPVVELVEHGKPTSTEASHERALDSPVEPIAGHKMGAGKENISIFAGKAKDDSKLEIESKGLYVLLSKTGARNKYHWGLLLAQDNTSGILYHQALAGLDWKFLVETSDITDSPNLLLALKIGVIERINDEWVQAIETCVSEVRVGGEFTCRTWLMTAVYQLALQGYLGLQPEWVYVKQIEKEAKGLAQKALEMETVIVAESDLNID